MAEAGGALDRLRRVSTLEWVALVAAVTPLVVVCVWALAVGWVPLGDSGQLVVRSRDVFTADHPFVGAWSSSSQVFKSDINNLGSLYSILLAPFTKIDPYGGAAIGVTAINAAGVVAVWFAARSLLGRVGAVVAMAATLVLIASMGVVSLLEIRQQVALVMPFWALLWTTALLFSGRAWAAPGVVFLASLIAQTHFTYLYQAVVLGLVGAVGAAVAGRRTRWAGWRSPLLVALAVSVVCWMQPLWDQAFGQGNLGAVLSQGKRGAAGAPGWRGGASLISRAGLRYPFVLPGSMGDYVPFSFNVMHPAIGVWVALTVWFGGLTAVIAWAYRTRRPGVVALAAVGGCALAVAWYVASRIPPYGPSFAPQNYYWMWPTALLALSAVAVALVIVGTSVVRVARPVTEWAVGSVLVVAALGGSVLTGALPQVAVSSFHRRTAARSFVQQVASGLEAHHIDGPVVIDYRRDSTFSAHRYTFLAELQRRGQRFTFLGDEGSTHRFGRRRCADDSVKYRLYLVTGRVAVTAPVPDAVRIARVDASPDQYRTLSELDRAGGRRIRSGAISVDLGRLAKTHPAAAIEVGQVRENSGRAAAGLGPTLWFDALFGDAVDVSTAGQSFLDRWKDVQNLVWADRAAMFAAPEAANAPRPPCR
ncbi:MAG: hypothetical protein ACR2MB_13930 [Acidimicrobiales bacterium]